MLRKPPVKRLKTGDYKLNLDTDERALLLRLADELQTMNNTDPETDSRLRRLFPTAYHQDPDHDAEYQRLMSDDLRDSRAASITQMRTGLNSETLTESELLGLVRSINSLRLILGTQLDISEDTDSGLIADDDPLIAYHHLYDYLGWLLECSIQALSA